MGHSQADKAQTREKVLRIAARKVRQNGLDGPGIAEIMKAAGLTHGGFYKHFASRDDLLDHAVLRALLEGGEKMGATAGHGLAAFVDGYLSARHRDHPETGCALVPLGSPAGHGNNILRDAYQRQVIEYLDLIERESPARIGGDSTAMLVLSALVGAALLARAVPDQNLSTRLLVTVARQLNQVHGHAGERVPALEDVETAGEPALMAQPQEPSSLSRPRKT